MPCRFCEQEPTQFCISCGQGTCVKPEHIYALFCLRRMGTPADQVGSKFFFYCEFCEELTCSDCIIKQAGDNASVDEFEYTEFTCGNCTLRLLPVRFDNKNLWEAVEGMNEFKKFGGKIIEEGKLLTPYTGWHDSLQVYSGSIGWISFSTQKAIEPGEAFEVELAIAGRKYRLLHYKFPEPYTLLDDGAQSIYIDRHSVWYGKGFSITADHQGAFLANKGPENIMYTKKGIIASKGFVTFPPITTEVLKTDNPKKEMFRKKLKELTGKAIWDYMLTQSETEFRKGEVHIAGSTDLSYYHLVEMYFKKVTWCTLSVYFHHPVFALAEGVLEEQIRDLRGIYDEDQYVFVIHDDAGSAGELRWFVVAEYLFIEFIVK